MAKVTITEAAKLAGYSRQHFYRKYVNTGKITIEKNSRGNKVVDTAEILRLTGQINGGDKRQATVTREVTRSDDEKRPDITGLEAEIKGLREQLTEYKEREAWMRDKVDQLTDQLKLVEHKPEENKGFWARVFNK